MRENSLNTDVQIAEQNKKEKRTSKKEEKKK